MSDSGGVRILLFGGSFDPIHHGHLLAARAAAERLDIRRVVLIPSATPPHKQNKQLAPAAERLTMCRLAVAGDPLFEVDDWELRQSGPNYTLNTVAHFASLHPPPAQLFWLIGADSLNELETWRRVGDLAELCTLVTAARPGAAAPDLSRLSSLVRPAALARIAAHVLETPRMDISATEIRSRIAAGRSIRYLAPEAVIAHIERSGLYRGG